MNFSSPTTKDVNLLANGRGADRLVVLWLTPPPGMLGDSQVSPEHVLTMTKP